MNFTISVKNNDSSACTGATFNLSDIYPPAPLPPSPGLSYRSVDR